MDDAEAVPHDYTVTALTPETWEPFADLVERHNGIFGGCWCTYFHSLNRDPERTYDSNRELKKRLVEEGVAHAALVMHGGEAVAWAEYGSCAELPNIHHRKEWEVTSTRTPEFRVTCIFVDRRHRRGGLSAIALQGALDQIATAGGGVVEGYPRDADGPRVSSSFVYNGTRSLYERLGFTYDRSKGTKNCVMVREVAAQ